MRGEWRGESFEVDSRRARDREWKVVTRFEPSTATPLDLVSDFTRSRISNQGLAAAPGQDVSRPKFRLNYQPAIPNPRTGYTLHRCNGDKFNPTFVPRFRKEHPGALRDKSVRNRTPSEKKIYYSKSIIQYATQRTDFYR